MIVKWSSRTIRTFSLQMILDVCHPETEDQGRKKIEKTSIVMYKESEDGNATQLRCFKCDKKAEMRSGRIGIREGILFLGDVDR